MTTNFADPKVTPPPKDGTVLLLIVKATKRTWHPTDNSKVFMTIGSNTGDDNGKDFWHIAGWNWNTDEYTETTGEILGWARLPEIPRQILIEQGLAESLNEW